MQLLGLERRFEKRFPDRLPQRYFQENSTGGIRWILSVAQDARQTKLSMNSTTTSGVRRGNRLTVVLAASPISTTDDMTLRPAVRCTRATSGDGRSFDRTLTTSLPRMNGQGVGVRATGSVTPRVTGGGGRTTPRPSDSSRRGSGLVSGELKCRSRSTSGSQFSRSTTVGAPTAEIPSRRSIMSYRSRRAGRTRKTTSCPRVARATTAVAMAAV